MRSVVSKAFSLVILSSIGLTITGCATYPSRGEPTQKSNLTAGIVKTGIVKGKTTQADIMKTFGAPNLVTKNRSNNEVWNYNRMSFESRAGEDSGTLILWSGSRAARTATTKSFDLIIEFDEHDVVKDYSVISASF